MSATVNGKDILNAALTEGRIGVWTCELDADSDDSITGAVTIAIDGVEWRGTVIRGAAVSGRAHASIVGGAGGLGKLLEAKFYRQSSTGLVLADLMRETGETLSATSDARARTHQAARWSRNRAVGGQALREIADELGCSWRVLRDGTVWLGAETWPALTLEYDQVDDAPARGMIAIAPESPLVRPGVMFLDQHVSAVTTRIAAGEGLRQDVTFDDDATDSHGRLLRSMAAVVSGLVGNKLDYARMYSAKVVKQNSDGTLELLCDDPTMRGTGISHVPIRHGLPGVKVKVPAGGKILLFFENGSPVQPAAALWPDGSSCTEISIEAPTLKVIGDLVVTGEVTANALTAPVPLSKHLHPTAMGPSDKPTPMPV